MICRKVEEEDEEVWLFFLLDNDLIIYYTFVILD